MKKYIIIAIVSLVIGGTSVYASKLSMGTIPNITG